MKLFLTGGFLGSGKTTAIQRACLYLQQQHIPVGVITNDQGNQQVDTRYIKSNNIAAEEVANSCFCCNYPAFEKGIKALRFTDKAEVIFAESVGSCTDLAATIVNPLLAFNPGEYQIVLSVFADICLLVMYLQNNGGMFFEEVTYIYQKQLEEADVIIVNKIDLVSAGQLAGAKQLIESKYPGKKILYQNSLSTEDIKAWVDAMMYHLEKPEFRKPLVIDYDTYGKGEAWLTWLDREITITAKNENAAEAAYLLMKKIYTGIHAGGYPIGHLKFFVDAGGIREKVSLTTLHDDFAYEPPPVKVLQARLLINARVQVTPEVLKTIVSGAVAETKAACDCHISHNNESCFIPGYPKPTHRIAG